jgi:presenilin-like A22 family membrane protease
MRIQAAMTFDITLPIILILIAAATIFLSEKMEKRVKTLFEEKEFTIRDAVLLVVAMGAMVTALVFVPSQAILVLFLWVFCVALFMITYLISQKWFLGFIGPVIFLVLYFVFRNSWVWNYYLLDTFAFIFIVFITVYVGSFFTWKTTLAFALFLTIMDVIQVLGTRYMVTTSQKVLSLSLPIFIVVPVVPSLQYLVALGLGDLFLTGLLSIQTAKKFGRRFAIESTVLIALVFGIVEALALTYYPKQALPATVMIFGGWLIAIATKYGMKLLGKEALTLPTHSVNTATAKN